MKKLAALTSALALAFLFPFLGNATAWADVAEDTVEIEFSANPVTEGDMVTITGTALCDGVHPHGGFCDEDDKPITIGKIQIQQAQDVDGNPVACDDPDLDHFETVDQGPPPPDELGQFSTIFDTTGLGGSTTGFRAHYVRDVQAGAENNPRTNASGCIDLEILLAGADPLPDGTTSFTQGYYGASPVGEIWVELIINGSDEPEELCNEISGILDGIEEELPFDLDCSDEDSRGDLALFLTGDVGPGRERPKGFLPAGFPPGENHNLAAQKITMLLNLNLDAIPPELLGEGNIPMDAGFYLNIDPPVQDIVDGVPDGFFDPILTTGGELGTCDDTTPADDVCDDGTIVLTPLGEKVEDLDDAGTTVQDILDAADDLLESGDPDIDVNGVTLTPGDLTGILGLINESYDEGVPTGFITAYDAD